MRRINSVKNFLKNRSLRHKAFTLIELLVVISIISLLSSVILAALSGARQKGNDAKIIQERSQIEDALEIYANANGGYPNPPSLDPATDNTSFWCIGGTNCYVNGYAITNQLSSSYISIGAMNTVSVTTSGGLNQGFVYQTYDQANGPNNIYVQRLAPSPGAKGTTDIHAAQLISTTQAQGTAEQKVGLWTVQQYVQQATPGT